MTISLIFVVSYTFGVHCFIYLGFRTSLKMKMGCDYQAVAVSKSILH